MKCDVDDNSERWKGMVKGWCMERVMRRRILGRKPVLAISQAIYAASVDMFITLRRYRRQRCSYVTSFKTFNASKLV